MGERGKETNDPRMEEWTDIHILYLMLLFILLLLLLLWPFSCSSSCSSSSYSCWALLVIVWISEFVLCKNHYDIRLSKANNKRGSTTIVFLQGYAWFNRCPSLTEFSQLFIDSVWHAVKDSI